MPLQWSEPREPNDECPYTHVVSETPLGTLQIEWKGWKDNDGPTCNLPWESEDSFVVGDDLDDAKRKVQDAWDKQVARMAMFASDPNPASA